MTKEEYDKKSGTERIFTNSFCTVRIKHDKDTVHIFVHDVLNDKESLPLAYMLGTNALTFFKKE